jgi:hypothetical protein
VVEVDAVPAGLADGVTDDVRGRARGRPGEVDAVAPAADGEALDRDLPAADEEPIAFSRLLKNAT